MAANTGVVRCVILAIAMLSCARLAVAADVAPPGPAIELWPNGAPGSQGDPSPETVRLTAQGEHILSNIHRPSIIPYLPDPAKATGAAVVVLPGGGHRELWMDHEGYRVGEWLSAHGVAAFVLKYRLAKQPGSTYTVAGTSLSDVRRAIRLVRSRAGAWNIATDRIGVMGFSAGGELAALAGTRFDSGVRGAPDPIDAESSRPDFMALIYPAIPADLAPPPNTPPAFLLCGETDDPAIALGLPRLFLSLKKAGASAELHILTGAGHGFGIRESNPPGVAQWITLFATWLDAQGFTAHH
jgi:endo-1,4-beta-xylanase